MAHKPKYARQEPRRNTALKLLPLVLVAIVAVVLIVRSLGKGKPDDAPTTPPTTEATQPLEPVASATVGVRLHDRGRRLRFCIDFPLRGRIYCEL